MHMHGYNEHHMMEYMICQTMLLSITLSDL